MKTITQTTELVEVENLTEWLLYFRRLTEGGDFVLKPKGDFPDYVSLEELQAQIRNNNKLFTGIDGRGNHARIRIVDDEVRKTLFHSVEGESQTLLTQEAVEKLLSIKDRDKFSDRLKELVVTESERKMFPVLAEKAGIDDEAAWKQKIVDSYLKPRKIKLNEKH